MKTLSVKEFYDKKHQDLALSLVSEPESLEGNITDSHLHRPGLALTGYLERFAYKRIQILGETEISYIQTLSEKVLYSKVKDIFEFSIPLIILTKGLSVPQQMINLANDMNIAIMSSRLPTDKLITNLSRYLQEFFAAQKSVHGTLIEVFGVGLLITGKSGIGKSECALDLVERGHRLIADDLVKITLNDDILYGSSVSDIGFFMEVKGVGLIDIERMYGIEAVQQKTVIDTQVELLLWQDNMDYERIGLTKNFVDVLGKGLPIIYLPVSPGKNISVIMEVIALNNTLKQHGFEAAEVYQERQQQKIRNKSKPSQHNN